MRDGGGRKNEALWSWNLVSNRVHFSPEWLRLVGCEEHELGNTPQSWLQRVHPEDVAQVSSTLDALLTDASGEFEVRHRMRHNDGSYRWTLCRGAVQRNSAQQAVHINASHTDVTADTASDTLTGLPNRLLLVEHLTRSIERASRYPGYHFAVLCIDLGLETDAGDAPGRETQILLSAAARRLETSLRTRDVPATMRNDDVVARLHDDVFAILLDGLKELGHATIAADRILTQMLAPFVVGGHEVRLSPSIGIAVSATARTEADDVLRDADTALHRARLLGRSRCEVFDTAALQTAQAELQLAGDFQGALERGQFRLFYQPIVSVASNQIVGCEALVRWQHPVLGLVAPVDFIPLAERTGFIVPLGRWVLREACLQLKAWHDSVPLAADLSVSINLSSPQFKHPALVAEILEALHDSALDARHLVLELTEGMALENPEEVKSLLMQIRALGVRVSVDDFGTGYSALAYLRQLPLDSLKIDRAFVRGIETNPDMMRILAAVTGMAQQLGLQVVVEGVEKEEQLTLLRSMDCGFVQGYIFSKPLDIERMTALLNAGLPTRPEGQTAPVTTPDPVAGGPAEDTREPWWRARRMRWSYAAAAAALLILVGTVGVPRYFFEESSPLAPGAIVNPPVDVTDAPRTAEPSRATASSAESGPRAAADVTPSPTPSAQPALERKNVEPRRAATAAATRPVAVVPRAAAVQPTSLPVVHQHRLGSCRGLLVVSRAGIAFIPDEHDGDRQHKLDLRNGQFFHSRGRDNLTIKSSDGTYRFKPADATGVGENQFSKLILALPAAPDTVR